jgi:hypothetical protein
MMVFSDMSLDYWQNRLHQHFAVTAAERSANGRPVFALEHGLTQTDREALAREVRASLTVRSPSDAYWLPWIVYATEVGYAYDGEEYWQTFEETTSGWATCRSRPRDWLRDRFVRFHKSYNGLKPSGRWAEWFTIIAWPIQHAILPGYLQYHMAKLLYELRFDLTAQLLADPTALGEYLHAESGSSVKRLQEFAEEHALIGTIATALLLSDNELTNVSLLPGTLRRLITDLEREQRARNWLRVAQDQARSVSLRGFSPRTTSITGIQPQELTISKKEVPELEPSLLLVPDGNEWRLFLETPDVTALTTQFPRFRSVLAASRCAIGTAGKWQSRGWLLHGPHRVPLSAWPQPADQLLRLENRDPTLDALFRADFLLRPGPTRLFKIGTDGMAREIRNLSVRAGQHYLILKTTGALQVEPPATAANVRCAGIKAVILDLPATLDTKTTAYLERLGLNVWQTVRVWPVGLRPAAWDGEGWAEWLVTDQILVGITSDNPTESILVQLDGASCLALKGQRGPTLLALPQLELGLHRLLVRVQNAGPNPAEQSGVLEFLIRAPRARLEAYKAFFRVAVDPDRSSMDDLWRGAVNIDVHGPSGRGVTPRIELAATTGGPALAHKILPKMKMPVTADEWKKAFREHCDGDSALENHFDDAKECRLQFGAGELGASTVRFEHERRPLRWHVQRANQGFMLRLVNEGVDDDATVVDLYSYERPDQATSTQGIPFSTPVMTPPSGLFLARNDKAQTGIIAPPAVILKGLAGLGLNPQLRHRRPIPNDIEELIHTYERWASARIIHHTLSFSFRHRILTTVESAIGDLLYEEPKVLGGPPSEARLERLRDSISDSRVRSLLTSLRAEVLSLQTSDRAECFARRLFPLLSYTAAIPFPNPNGLPRMAEFALRLASAPDGIARWAGDHLIKGLQFALKYHTIMRAARYIVLSGDLAGGAKPLAAGPLHDGWEWS